MLSILSYSVPFFNRKATLHTPLYVYSSSLEITLTILHLSSSNWITQLYMFSEDWEQEVSPKFALFATSSFPPHLLIMQSYTLDSKPNSDLYEQSIFYKHRVLHIDTLNFMWSIVSTIIMRYPLLHYDITIDPKYIIFSMQAVKRNLFKAFIFRFVNSRHLCS